MARTITRQIDFERLRLRSPNAAVIIKLMMAANDMAYANLCLGEYKAAIERGDRNTRLNGGLYWVRLQLAHMSEAFHILEEIRDNVELIRLLERCDLQTQESFNKLRPFMHGGDRHNEFNQLVERVRSNVTFHYQCDKLILKAIRSLASAPEHRFSSISRGDTVSQWHFQVADVVLDSIVVRELWKVPMVKSSSEGADEAAWKAHLIFLSFMDFSGEFIWKFCET